MRTQSKLSSIGMVLILCSQHRHAWLNKRHEACCCRGGKTKLQGFFQGQVMKESGGRVNPEKLAKLLPKELSSESSA